MEQRQLKVKQAELHEVGTRLEALQDEGKKRSPSYRRLKRTEALLLSEIDKLNADIVAKDILGQLGQ